MIEVDPNDGISALLLALFGGDEKLAHDALPLSLFKPMALKKIDRSASESTDMLITAIVFPTLSEEEKAECFTEREGQTLLVSREEAEARMKAMREGPHAHEVMWLEDDAVCFHDVREPEGVLRRPIPKCADHGPLIRTMAERYIARVGSRWSLLAKSKAHVLIHEDTMAPEEQKAYISTMYAEAGIDPHERVLLDESFYN